MTKPPIVLLTDFGDIDPYVGIMKGVISTIAPHAQIIDLAHKVPPGDIRRGAFILWQSLRYFPDGTIFACVIDPGVGTTRRSIIIQSNQRLYVGPDNGLFTFIAGKQTEIYEIKEKKYTLPQSSNTFHGRDIYAPIAAHLWNGIKPHEMGQPINELIQLEAPTLQVTESGDLIGEVLFSDHFGNIITSLGIMQKSGPLIFFESWLSPPRHKRISLNSSVIKLPNGDKVGWYNTFAEIPNGQIGAIIGSTGLIEIVANQQSAQKLTGLQPGDMITITHTD